MCPMGGEVQKKKMDLIFNLTIFDYIAVLITTVVAHVATIQWIRFVDQRRKRRMMENFLSHIQEKIETEEEFQEIIDKMKRDYKNE